jgi:hypothetical protein
MQGWISRPIYQDTEQVPKLDSLHASRFNEVHVIVYKELITKHVEFFVHQ